jgi:fumarate reductase subunit D
VWGRLAGFLIDLGLASLLLLLLVFPDGRFVPRWTRWVAALALVQLSADIFFPDSLFVDPPQALNVSAFLCLWAICLFAQVYRYRRVSGPIQRQQTKWLVFGVTALVVLLAGFLLPYAFFPPLDRPGVLSLTYDLVGRAVVGSLAFLLIPMSIGVAILRYRLYDIDVVINRTLVYSLLTVALILVYVGSVVSLQRIFVALTGNDSQLSIVASTLAIAALFGPLRRRIQAFIDRRFYRKKYDARKTLEAFNARLRNETNLDALVRDLVAAVGETMQPEHVSVWLRPSPGTSPRPEERTR